MRDIEAALKWITSLFEERSIPYQAVGGLAAHAHGGTRPLADLDFYVPADRIGEVAAATRPHVVREPTPYSDANWEVVFMALEYGGWRIEVGAADGARIFDRASGAWLDQRVDFASSESREVYGVAVRVMPLEPLLAYKQVLGREVDEIDIAELRGRDGGGATAM